MPARTRVVAVLACTLRCSARRARRVPAGCTARCGPRRGRFGRVRLPASRSAPRQTDTGDAALPAHRRFDDAGEDDDRGEQTAGRGGSPGRAVGGAGADCSGVLPALPADIADADVPALLADIERRVEALPGAFDAAVARQQQVVAVNAVAVAMQARNLRRITDRALALIEARLAALMPANPTGRPPRPADKPDGQLAGFDAGAPDRAPSAATPAETSVGSPQAVDKPDGQLADSGAGEADRVPLPSARTMRDIRAAHPDPADKQALRERMDRLEDRGSRVRLGCEGRAGSVLPLRRDGAAARGRAPAAL